MANLVGRDEERRRIESALAMTLSANVAAGIRVTGPSGVGKTALFAVTAAKASTDGWLCAPIQCHKIQSTLSYVTARRLAEALAGALGPDRERYAGGLDAALTSPQTTGEALFRLVEGILLDFPVLLAIDEAQWIDPESRDLIDRLIQSFADRRIALLAMERSDEAGGLQSAQLTIPLGHLSAAESAILVRAHYAAAGDEVVNAILTHAEGHPIDLVTLAESAREMNAERADDVEASVRTIISRQLNALDPQLREFLQLSSLIPEPIEYGILARLWPQDRVLSAFIEAASGRFLIQDQAGLRFKHSIIAQSVRETLAVDIPYRRRILNTLTQIEHPTLEDRERIAQQALACGDNALARNALTELASQAARENALFTAADAFERALQIATPDAQGLVRFYLDYSAVLTMQGRMSETKLLMQRALDDAARLGVTQGLGGLSATLLISLWATKGYAEALARLPSLTGQFSESNDRMQLLSVASWLHACADDLAAFESNSAALRALANEMPPEIAMRLHIAEAWLHIRRGDGPAASELSTRALSIAGNVRSANRRSAEVSHAVIDLLRFGLQNAQTERAILHMRAGPDATRTPVLEFWRTICIFANGNLGEVQDVLRESLTHLTDAKSRRNLLCLGAAIEALTQAPSPQATLIEGELLDFLGGEDDGAFAIASWRAATIAHTNPARARALIERSLSVLEQPPDPEAFVSPFALALAATRLKERPLLERLSDFSGLWEDRSPWQVAQRRLAMGYAREALRRGSGLSYLREAHQRFEQLRLPLFAAIAGAALDPPDKSAIEFLQRLELRGIGALNNGSANATERKKKGQPAPSRREMEIIALVAQGNSNREIAEALFLSERTVEAHIANIFAKLNVSKRTQVAAWYVRSSSSASSQTHSQPG